jgi:hypothetical protein
MNKRQRVKQQKKLGASPLPLESTSCLSREDCTLLAIEVWRIRKSLKMLPDSGKAAVLAVSVEKLEDLLHKLKLEIHDPVGECYTEGMTLSVALFETTPRLPSGVKQIAETVSPTIFLGGRVLQPGRVIVEVGEGEA